MTDQPRVSTFQVNGKRHYGLVHDHGITDLASKFGDKWPTLSDVIRDGALRQLIDGAGATIDFNLADIQFDPPLPSPEKIICVGVNYPDRNAEYKDGQDAPQNMSLFVRFARSFVGHEQPLIRPKVSDKLDYEGEIAIVIGTAGRHIPDNKAFDHIAAVTMCNEGTIRDWVRHAKFNVTQGKNFDASGAMGPWLVPFTDRAQLEDVRLTTRVSGEVRQDDRTSRMIFGFARQIAYISTFTTLTPGDIIVTGTPTGAGARFDPPVFLQPGDIVEVEAEGIGVLRNSVADET